MRLFIAARSMIADSRLAEAVAAGVRQAVVLVAGLDTLSLRNPHPEASIFEVDHPATQAWKQRRLADEDLEAGPNTRFVPVDFEHQSLGAELAAAGFDRARPAFFMWLGVVPYLTEEAVFGTLGYVAGVPGAQIVFDYANPDDSLPGPLRAAHAARAARAAAIGEPFLSSFDSDDLRQRLATLGAAEVDDVGPRRIAHLLGAPEPAGGDVGGHVLFARWT
jgi:methyltransferase (TIGR00027 family)